MWLNKFIRRTPALVSMLQKLFYKASSLRAPEAKRSILHESAFAYTGMPVFRLRIATFAGAFAIVSGLCLRIPRFYEYSNGK